jgi:hypothetical protein
MRSLRFPVLTLLAAAACGGDPSLLEEETGTVEQSLLCASYTAPQSMGSIPTSYGLNEVSGLAASRNHPGVLWLHEDSGAGPVFWAMSSTAQVLARIAVTGTGVSAVDWEDMALGPCAAGSANDCIYIGDIGDNGLSRSNYALYRIPEPNVNVGDAYREFTVTATKFPYQYPGGANYNSETLMVHPTTATPYIVEKHAPTTGPSRVFKFPMPLTAGAVATLTQIDTVSFPDGSIKTTGGDIHPSGTRLLIRTYNRLWEYRLPSGAAFDSIFNDAPQLVPVASEPQGEAVAYRVNGEGYFTQSEQAGSTTVPPLWRTSCQ